MAWGTTAGTASKHFPRKKTKTNKPHKVLFVSILGHSALFTRTTAQSLLPHIVLVFIAPKEKHFQPCKMVSIRDCNLHWHWRQSGKSSIRSKSQPCCTTRVMHFTDHYTLLPYASNPELALWNKDYAPLRKSLTNAYEVHQGRILGYQRKIHLHAHSEKGSTIGDLGHATTYHLHQAHKQLNQAAQPSLKASAYLTLKITPACSALHWFVSNIVCSSAIQNILQMSKTTQPLTVPLKAEVYTMLLEA